MKKVELHPAYFYTCESCGVDQWIHGITPEMSDEDRADLAEQIGADPGEEGEWTMAPERVVCTNRRTEFLTDSRRLGQSIDDDSDGEATP